MSRLKTASACRRLGGGGEVHVSVDQSGHQKAPGKLDDLRLFRNAGIKLGVWKHLLDALAGDQHVPLTRERGDGGRGPRRWASPGKLSSEGRDALLAISGSKPLQYEPDQPVSKSYVVVPEAMLSDSDGLRDWIVRSAAGLAPKSVRSRKTF